MYFCVYVYIYEYVYVYILGGSQAGPEGAEEESLRRHPRRGERRPGARRESHSIYMNISTYICIQTSILSF
jgi:hypothetical protein